MKSLFKVIFLITFSFFIYSQAFAEDLIVSITDLKSNPESYNGKTVSVDGFFSIWKNAPGAPPISRSDWVLCDSKKNSIYCNGVMPSNEETGEIAHYWQPMNVLGKIQLQNGKPYISVISTKIKENVVEKMVTVQQLILNQNEMMGNYIGVMGILAKGYSLKGERLYLIADPTGVIRIGKMKKLYPKGTILHLKGYLTTDEYGIPMIDHVEIISAKIN